MNSCKIYLEEVRPNLSVDFFDNTVNSAHFNNMLAEGIGGLKKYTCQDSEDLLTRTTTWEYEYQGDWYNLIMSDPLILGFLLLNEMYDRDHGIVHGPYKFEVYDENNELIGRGTLTDPSKRT